MIEEFAYIHVFGKLIQKLKIPIIKFQLLNSFRDFEMCSWAAVVAQQI